MAQLFGSDRSGRVKRKSRGDDGEDENQVGT